MLLKLRLQNWYKVWWSQQKDFNYKSLKKSNINFFFLLSIVINMNIYARIGLEKGLLIYIFVYMYIFIYVYVYIVFKQ